MHRTSSPEWTEGAGPERFTQEEMKQHNITVQAIQTLRQFKENIVFTSVRQLCAHLTPVNRKVYSFAARSFYSSSVI